MRVHLTPKAARERIGGLAQDAAGEVSLRVAVTAVAEKGKANAAMIAALAKAWDLPKSTLAVVSGAKDRRKVLSIRGDGDRLAARLTNWFKEHNGESESH